MKLLGAALWVAIAFAACGGSGSSPKVPKEAIEKSASTKIADAGTLNADDAAAP
jgi:hypothetical protein